MGFAQTVKDGDQRLSLVALRDLLAGQIESAAPRDVAALALRLTDVMDRLTALPVEKKGTVADELAARRTEPGRVSAVSARTRRG